MTKTLLSPRHAALPTRTFCLTSLLAAFILIFLRAPLLMIHGRVYAEEGPIYFHYAWNVSFWRGLIALHQGYLSLFVNFITAIAAHFTPLARLPLLLVWSSLGVMLWVASLVLTCEVFTSNKQRIAALAIYVFASPSVESWLNTINCQFLFAIGTAILLISTADRRVAERSVFLVVAGLDGVISCTLLPFFWLRYFRNRTSANLLPATLLSFTTAFQAFCVLSSARPLSAHHFDLIGAIFLEKIFLLPFFTRLPAVIFSRTLLTHPSSVSLLESDFAFLLLAGSLIALIWPSISSRWLLAAAFLLDLISWFGAADPTTHALEQGYEGRYFIAGNTVIGLAILLRSFQRPADPSQSSGSLRRKVAATLAIGFCLSGAAEFIRYRQLLENFPPWQIQVTAWRTDPSLRFNVDPVGFHPFRLSPTHQDDPNEIDFIKPAATP